MENDTTGKSDIPEPGPGMGELLQRERSFHDRWAESIDVDGIRVSDYFEACTSPENRFILGHLGDVNGKTLLDLGCGAGENSVYFSLKGARCTATDYSSGMVEKALKLAAANGVQIEARTMNALEIEFRPVRSTSSMRQTCFIICPTQRQRCGKCTAC